MENMIKRIVDMDQKARAITDAAQQEKLNSEKEIAEKADQLREDYLNRARHRIQLNGDTERRVAEEAWKKRQTYYTAQATRLEALYEAHRDEWVNTIVRHVEQGTAQGEEAEGTAPDEAAQNAAPENTAAGASAAQI